MCSFLLRDLAVAYTVQTCFSNRLLPRLYGAEATVEALMGVAFRWEVACMSAMATIQDRFTPCMEWFWNKFLCQSRLVREFKQGGATGLLADEAFTVHPLLMAVLLWVVLQFGVVFVFVGEALQINSLQNARMRRHGWFEPFAFLMEPWRSLEQSGQLLYFQLEDNFRLPQAQFAMLRRVRVVHVVWKCALLCVPCSC